MFTPAQLKQLTAPLPRDAVKTRRQAGSQLAYVEGQYVIDALNKIVGFGMWDHRVVEVVCVAEEKTQTKSGRDAWDVAYRATVRLTVRNDEGAQCVHEDVGGDGSRLPSRGDAHENALKGAVTDALKRAARCMGEQFGLSLYGDLSKVDVEPEKTKEQLAAEARQLRETMLSWAVDQGVYPDMEAADRAYQVVRQDVLDGHRKAKTKPTVADIKAAWAAEVKTLQAANAEAAALRGQQEAA